MKEFTMEVRNIYGTKLDDYIITAGSREYAFELAEQYSKKDFPEYLNGVGIFCINEEQVLNLPIKESEIKHLKRALDRLCLYYDDIKNKQKNPNSKKYYEDLFNEVLDIYIKVITHEEEQIESEYKDD